MQSSFNGKGSPSKLLPEKRKFSSCLLPPDSAHWGDPAFIIFRAVLKTEHCLHTQKDDLSVRFLLNESQLVHET